MYVYFVEYIFYYPLVLGTKRDLYFGCSGLIVGIVIGVAIGISVKKREQAVRYMQAIQCSNYLGIEVQICQTIIYLVSIKKNF